MRDRELFVIRSIAFLAVLAAALVASYELAALGEPSSRWLWGFR